MKQDEHLKKLLVKHAVEQTADDFTAKIMQQIISEAVHRSHSFLPGKFRIKHLLIVLSIIVTLALVITSLFLKPLPLPTEIKIELPDFLARHFYNFLILIPAFWILVLTNLRYERRVRM